MRSLIIFITFVLLFNGCGKKVSEKTKTAPKKISTEQYLQEASVKIISHFSTQLKQELTQALNNGDAAKAISVCQTKVPEISELNSITDLWKIRRVSEKYRNPKDKPNDYEKEILIKLIDSTQNLTYLTKWSQTDSNKVFHYYKPIRVSQLCLKCHGQKNDLDPQVIQVLKDKYPHDKATGYQIGDLYGMYVVDIEWPQAKDAIKNLMRDSL
ncbi:MAG: DUF3365 domain-containing protein [FCB group bacterium]|nr:DUF3365 domain-containing protein [FCB group bacterium]